MKNATSLFRFNLSTEEGRRCIPIALDQLTGLKYLNQAGLTSHKRTNSSDCGKFETP